MRSANHYRGVSLARCACEPHTAKSMCWASPDSTVLGDRENAPFAIAALIQRNAQQFEIEHT